jgi:hypothetical protein
VQKILEDGTENKLIPVDNWAVFGEKGGLKGVVDYFPVEEVMVVLSALYQAREAVKQALYEISGISDIVRGATKASETATAQKIKGQFATLRIDAMQAVAARFSRDIIGIMTEIIAEHFSMDTIKRISGVPLLTEQEKQQAMMAAQQGQPLPANIKRMLKDPTWEEVEKIIRDDMARCFAIDVETDSTIKIDQENDKKMRSEFLGAVSNFLQQAAQIQDPSLKPLLGELLLFGTKGFKIGRDLETAFVTMIDEAKEQAAQPPAPPPPDPSIEISKMQQQQQAEANQANMRMKGAELNLKEKEAMEKIQLEREKLDIEREQLRLREREIMLNAQNNKESMTHDMKKAMITSGLDPALVEDTAGGSVVVDMLGQVANALNAGLENQALATAALAESINNPPRKRVDVIRESGDIVGLIM